MTQSEVSSWTSINEVIEAYESSREQGKRPRLHELLPREDHESYSQIACELIRVDMEYSWNEGQRKRLCDFQEALPKVFADPDLSKQIAFEEYRLRIQAGEQVIPRDYAKKYGFDTSDWPQWISAGKSELQPAAGDSATNAGLPEIWKEAQDLVEEVQELPSLGDVFLGFQLERVLGQGSFARVYLARQGDLSNRHVVLKIASRHSLEPQHLARLQHTNIVPIHSVHSERGLMAVCVPYFGDRTLADLLDTVRKSSDTISTEHNLISTFFNHCDETKAFDRGYSETTALSEASARSPIPAALVKTKYVDAVVWLMHQLADGIAHAHTRGIVHRDLKPANVLLTDNGQPMVLDFNLSEDVVVNGRASLLVGGTLPYMSPEHLEAVSHGGKVGPQTDIYSIGVIFSELLTGKRPFPDYQGPFHEVVQKMLDDRRKGAPPVCSLNSSVPASIGAVVQKCLTIDLSHRYQSADELAEDLARHLRHEPLAFAPDRSLAERSRKWLKRHPRLSSGVGVACIASALLLVALTALFMRSLSLARAEAKQTFASFQSQQPSLSMALGVRFVEPEVISSGIDHAVEALKVYKILERRDWQSGPAYRRLAQEDRRRLDLRLTELLYLLAESQEELSDQFSGDVRAQMIADALRFNYLASGLFPDGHCPQTLVAQRTKLEALQGTQAAIAMSQQLGGDCPPGCLIDQYAEVYEAINARNYTTARELLKTLCESNSLDAVAWVMLGDTHAALGNFDEAEWCLNTALALEPKSYAAHFLRALNRMHRGKYQEALEDLNIVIAMRPNLACGYLNRALAYQALRQYEKGLVDIDQALELGATQTRVYFIRSQLRLLTGDMAGAAEDNAKGLELTPSDELSWIARGVVRLKMDPQSAYSDFEQALKINPGSVAALRNIVSLMADRLHKPEDAMVALNQLLDINADDPKALAGRAVLLARKGDRTGALDNIQHLLNVSKAPQSLFQAACALSLTSEQEPTDLDNALVLLARAIQLEPIWLTRAQLDTDLVRLRENEGFQRLVDNFKRLPPLKMNLNNASAPHGKQDHENKETQN